MPPGKPGQLQSFFQHPRPPNILVEGPPECGNAPSAIFPDDVVCYQRAFFLFGDALEFSELIGVLRSQLGGAIGGVFVGVNGKALSSIASR